MKALLLSLCALVAGCGGVSFPGNSQWPGPTAPAFDAKARFAITNNKSDTLSFIAADGSGTHLGDVPIGDNPVELEGPHHLAASPDGQFIYYNLSNYVPGTGSGPHGSHGTGTVPGSLVKIDARTYEPLGEALVARSPGDIILSKDGKTAYVSHYDLIAVTQALSTPGATAEMADSPLAIVDTTTMTRLSLTPVCAEGHGEGLSADGKTLYITCALLDQLAVVDVSNPAHPTVTALVPVGPTPNQWPSPQPSYGPYALTVNPVDDTVWVSDNNSGDVRVYDPKTAAMDPTKTMVLGDVDHVRLLRRRCQPLLRAAALDGDAGQDRHGDADDAAAAHSGGLVHQRARVRHDARSRDGRARLRGRSGEDSRPGRHHRRRRPRHPRGDQHRHVLRRRRLAAADSVIARR